MQREINNIFLVGPMGAGKSTVGRYLARSLNWDFYDTDQEIEIRTGVDIPWIFDMEGELGFRDRETNVLGELTEMEGIVLATGGGIVMRQENRQLLKERGFVVYLQVDVGQQIDRTIRDKRRPLLQTDDRQEVLEKLVIERQPLYEEIADLTLNTNGENVRSVAEKLLRQLRKRAQ